MPTVESIMYNAFYRRANPVRVSIKYSMKTEDASYWSKEREKIISNLCKCKKWLKILKRFCQHFTLGLHVPLKVYYTTTFWKKYLLSNYGLTKIGPLNLDFQIFVFYAYVAQDNKISTNTNTTYVYPTLSLVSEIFQVSTLSCLLFNWLSSVLNMKIISPKYKLSANWGRRCPGKI